MSWPRGCLLGRRWVVFTLRCELTPVKVRDARGDCWVLGRPVGSGGFGDIYLCDRGQGGECGEEAR